MIGWMSKGMLDLAASLMAEKQVTTHLKAELAAERARVNWFMEHINELKIERAALYERIGVHLPVPTIQRVGPTAMLPGMDDNYVPPAGAVPADVGDLLAKARELREQAERTRAAGNPPADIPFQGFDDIGDEAAKAIGAQHTTDGRVVFTR